MALEARAAAAKIVRSCSGDRGNEEAWDPELGTDASGAATGEQAVWSQGGGDGECECGRGTDEGSHA